MIEQQFSHSQKNTELRTGFSWQWRFRAHPSEAGRMAEFSTLTMWVLGYVAISQVGVFVVNRVANARAGGPTTYANADLPTRDFDGRTYLFERPLKGDFAFVKAWKGDALGNLVFRKTARNFNPNVATAGKICVVEVEQLVEVGEIDPDQVHTPSIFVHRIVHNPTPEKRIEQRTVRPA